ncbi:pyrroloquinoline quinone biosynthesis protein PqqE (plasmid) [Sinorhizobium meliloti]|uniref:PqqA peptide cyclase n=1 Tax=Rhizobium meliloti TaxID=382 RepID=A0AAW9TSW0_RHIML|nr:pyrroloquinoline quinone biosynthesis protein PqqE [Sinorhizobium meliloti]MCM5692903.1 pyrroloquinoline quinone biosynthesis protein PqqE [Sinorhizobium meliloti]MDW9624794.1 pyrroloquinoline quinone biosynthesis protein PqqE [Sinorhizobium meliloti]MDW9995467.1 pyrroloquinoline quinone biosynthesis protein PqqE [Sinorhizobium meliloti]MQW34145.1 pyrroloquinoline quinone biosynthesis protein PqqE [Sinorhizobium meliloti]MQW41362.1 pyrroloquinoline quinone biosynthesis protein PqqE [Sinorhi
MSDTIVRPTETARTLPRILPPMAMLAELTHRCPLACPYCSNPIALTQAKEELSTEEWTGVFAQAADLGVLHLHLSGGEPAARRDLVELTQAASSLGLYTNLITSGVGLTEARMNSLADAGLDHIQLSIQGVSPESADRIGGYKGGYERKMAVAGWAADAAIPLTLNAVCHRQNMGEIDEMIELAIRLKARRIEVATVQFHGWAERNKEVLMPTREQVECATRTVAEAREKYQGILVIDYVPADYYSKYPKACMGGWGRVGLNVTPSGRVLPCHAAETIPSLSFENVRENSLSSIWYESNAFNAYRGEDWMPELCRSCERKKVDFGGCRCQAMALAGDASATDPVCIRSPLRDRLTLEVEQLSAPSVVPMNYRGRA